MKHGIAFRKHSRTSSHRDLMLRNLVTSLLKYEQIKTTLPKAEDAARLADKMISLGKKQTTASRSRARAFCLEDSVANKLFGLFANRYRDRNGGYTRIHKFGHRRGDNAPHAIVELVDNPRDLKFAMTARAIGWEIASWQIASPENLLEPVSIIKSSLASQKTLLRPLTALNLRAVAKSGPLNEKVHRLAEMSGDWMRKILSDPMFRANLRKYNAKLKQAKEKIVREGQELRLGTWESATPHAGQRIITDFSKTPGMWRSMGGLRLSKGRLAQTRSLRVPGSSLLRRKPLGISDVRL